MVERLVECVPNVSEGRRRDVIGSLEGVIRSAAGVWLLDRQTDADHNRSVFTFAGTPQAVVEAAARLAERSAELIDLNRHRGEHPRIGALDVLPFVPLRGISMDDCATLAHRAGEAIWERCGVPVYFYGEAAVRPDRRNLADVRRGQFETLRDVVKVNADRRPDLGGPALHPTAGAIAAGARPVMIAYNILLETGDVSLARTIARRVRESSGGLPNVKAIGVMLASRGLAQVSMNLTDYALTPPHAAFAAVAREAEALGTSVRSSELIGLIPQRALDVAGGIDLRWENLNRNSILEVRLQDMTGVTLEESARQHPDPGAEAS